MDCPIVWIYEDGTEEYLEKIAVKEYLEKLRDPFDFPVTRYQHWPESWMGTNVWYWTIEDFNRIVEEDRLERETLYFTIEN